MERFPRARGVSLGVLSGDGVFKEEGWDVRVHLV